ncbi:MAG: helix-turn-helix transcriptional regulator [Polyangiaceae bacterium]|nr:helix-turn-helix transcriptional regulator [Polyangiaceae bacterium]MCW5792538.1 helix-turn-helix transcriptional regulator [Polyangiaceae bacterium]
MQPIDAERLIRDVGRRLAELRESRGLTQQELADHLGVSMRYVQAVEAGTQNLTLRTLAEYLSVLGAGILAAFEAPRTRAKRRPGRPPRRSV